MLSHLDYGTEALLLLVIRLTAKLEKLNIPAPLTESVNLSFSPSKFYYLLILPDEHGIIVAGAVLRQTQFCLLECIDIA